MNRTTSIKPIGLSESLMLFGIPAIVFFIITRILMPYAETATLLHPLIIWFVCGGLLLFAPLFILAIILYKHDYHTYSKETFIERFRLYPLNRKDWGWTAISIGVILLFTLLIIIMWNLLSGVIGFREINMSNPFLKFSPLKGKESFLLLAWLPFFFFNIVGEELLWRGYILPGQELVFGEYAWLLNSALWLLFHFCFGLDFMVILIPTLLVIPYVVYKRKNTYIGIILHVIVNGPTFVLIALGVIK